MASYDIMASMWISIDERLPKHGETVLVRVREYYGRHEKSIQVAKITHGRTAEEVERDGIWGHGDVGCNNLVPFAWKAPGGPMTWLGQDVTHWQHLPKPPAE